MALLGGISIILLINIVSRMPSDFYNLYQMFVQGKDIVYMVISIVIILGVVLLTTVLTIILQDAERRIPVSYAQKVQGRRMVGARSSHMLYLTEKMPTILFPPSDSHIRPLSDISAERS